MLAGAIDVGQRTLRSIEKWKAKNACHFPTPPTATTAGIYLALPCQEGGGMADEEEAVSVEQIVGVLKQAEVGVPIAEIIRKAGISEQTFYRWKKQYVGLESDQVREMKQLQDENSRLKLLVAELSLDKTMLQDVLRKRW
jgi:putative transposase